MEGRGQPQATSESGGSVVGVGGDAAAKAEYSVANPSTISNCNVTTSNASSAGNLQLRKRGPEAVYEESQVGKRQIRDGVVRRDEEQAPPVEGAADLKQASSEHVAHETLRHPSFVSETANAGTNLGGAIPANDPVPEQVSSVAEARSQRPPGVVFETANASSTGDAAIPADALSGARQTSPVAAAGNAVQNRAAPPRRKLKLGFSLAESMAYRLARRQEAMARPQHAEAATSDPVPAADAVSAEVIDGLIRDGGTSKMVINGTNLSREYVFGLLVVRPIVYLVDPGAKRAVAVFANEEDASAAWNHVKGASLRYGLTVTSPWGTTTIDLR